MFATKRAATRLEREAIGSSDVERFISQMRALCAVRCMYNVDWSEGASPDFNKTPCAVEFYVNGKGFEFKIEVGNCIDYILIGN
uniref:DUF5619 domain-containing protein n=1 Tax=Bursaphelenchus xylophilus TaxID=6326 RepID=A0A1I7SK19_BURXY